MSGLLKNDKAVKIIVFIGFALVALIFLSDIIGGTTSGNSGKKSEEDSDVAEREYEKRLEDKLYGAISEIDGAGKLTVVITLDSLSENVYTDKGAIKTVITPKVRGAAIICAGGDNIIVKQKIVETASKVLGISSARICVTK